MRISAGLPTGVSAALFDSVKRRRRLEARLTALLEERGFAEVLLPILDYFEPYRPLLQERLLKQLYRFVDRDGQLLVLRGDFTPMLARLLAPHLDDLELPALSLLPRRRGAASAPAAGPDARVLPAGRRAARRRSGRGG